MAFKINDIIIPLCGVAGVAYLLNLTPGMFEFIPDNIPFIGSLDEAAASAMVLYAMRHFGFDMFSLVDKLRANHHNNRNR
jgi:uncharacterized membrane protein YkvA (DUF1232 family)